MHVAPTTELKALLRLAGPLIASQLAHMLMVLTDTLMMARISPQALAGGGLGAASYSFVSIFCLGVIAAVGTLVAIRKGANDIEGATRLAQSGLWLAWGLALFAALVLWNLEPVLLLFGQKPENVASAAEFLTLLPLALPGYLTFMALRGFTSALGRSTPVMVISLIGTVLNYLFNVALIEGMFGLPKLGLMGIGLVTAVVSMGMAIALALYIRWHSAYAAYPLRKGLSRPSLPALRELWRLGLPIGGTYMVEVGLFAFAALCMGVLGSTEPGRAPDRPADRVHGVHGADGAVVCSDHAGGLVLRRWQPAGGAQRRARGHWLRGHDHVCLRRAVPAAARGAGGAVYRP